MRRTASIALLTLAAAGVSACAATRAQAPVKAEALVVPPVPPRVIVPDIEEIGSQVEDPAAARPAAPKPDTPTKPPEKPPETAPATATPPPVTNEPAPRVRTPNTANDEQAERAVRSIMARAQALLRGVDYRALSAAARQQYDTATRFIAQADRALRIRNYVFARNLADKAETLARQLGK